MQRLTDKTWMKYWQQEKAVYHGRKKLQKQRKTYIVICKYCNYSLIRVRKRCVDHLKHVHGWIEEEDRFDNSIDHPDTKYEAQSFDEETQSDETTYFDESTLIEESDEFNPPICSNELDQPHGIKVKEERFDGSYESANVSIFSSDESPDQSELNDESVETKADFASLVSSQLCPSPLLCDNDDWHLIDEELLRIERTYVYLGEEFEDVLDEGMDDLYSNF